MSGSKRRIPSRTKPTHCSTETMGLSAMVLADALTRAMQVDVGHDTLEGAPSNTMEPEPSQAGMARTP